MILYLTAATNIPDVYIDFIEVRLRNGKSVSLNWDESGIDRTPTGFEACYKSVCFDEEHANGRIADLEGVEIVDIGLYFETEGICQFKIDEMHFVDDEKELVIKEPDIPRDCSGMNGIVFMDDAMPSVAFVELQLNIYDEHDNLSREGVFAVPKDWLMDNVDIIHDSVLADFLSEYTSDDSQEIYDAALLDHKIVFECEASQLPDVKREYFRSHVIPALMADGITQEQVSEELTYRDNAHATEPHSGWDDNLIDYSTEDLEMVEALWDEVVSSRNTKRSAEEPAASFTFCPKDYEAARAALLSSGADSLPWNNSGYNCRLERAENGDIYYDLHLTASGATVMYGETVSIVGTDQDTVQIHIGNDEISYATISSAFFKDNFVSNRSPEIEVSRKPSLEQQIQSANSRLTQHSNAPTKNAEKDIEH